MTKPFRAEQIEPARAYSTREASVFLGPDADTVAAMAKAGDFGPDGAWPLRSIHGRVTAYRIAGWAITAWIKRNAIRAA